MRGEKECYRKIIKVEEEGSCVGDLIPKEFELDLVDKILGHCVGDDTVAIANTAEVAPDLPCDMLKQFGFGYVTVKLREVQADRGQVNPTKSSIFYVMMAMNRSYTSYPLEKYEARLIENLIGL
jgi:hypothetical protein